MNRLFKNVYIKKLDDQMIGLINTIIHIKYNQDKKVWTPDWSEEVPII